jgi:hypothetical protein
LRPIKDGFPAARVRRYEYLRWCERSALEALAFDPVAALAAFEDPPCGPFSPRVSINRRIRHDERALPKPA